MGIPSVLASMGSGQHPASPWCARDGSAIMISVITFCRFSVSKSRPTLCDPMGCSTPGLPSLTLSWSLSKFMSLELVTPSNHLILCHRLLLLPSIFPSIGVFLTIYDNKLSHLFYSYFFVPPDSLATESCPVFRKWKWEELPREAWARLGSEERALQSFQLLPGSGD